jgi:hypothetical protein
MNRKLYDQRSRAKNALALSRQPPLASPPPFSSTTSATKVHVAVPKFKGRQSSGKDRAGPIIPRRRPRAQIQQEMEEGALRAQQTKQPLPAGPLLDEREKARCAELMEHRGALPELTEEEMALLQHKRAPPLTQSR